MNAEQQRSSLPGPHPGAWFSLCLLILCCSFVFPGNVLAQQGTAAPPAASKLDELTGSIALYPDEVIIHILTASKSFDTLKLFSGWLAQNANLKGTELQNAAQQFGFSDALVALAPFPQVVKMMVEKPDWTKALGQAVTEDKKAVGDSIQRLRSQAQSLGNLKTTPQQVVTVTNTVVQKTVEQQVVFVTNTVVQIQPANPQVIYVPTYPQTVYVQPAPYAAAGAALVGFTVGVIVADSWHHHYNYHEYWEDREDFYEDRQDNYQQNQDQRQQNSQQRQSERLGNQDQRQNGAASSQSQGTQQRSAGTATAQSQGAQRQGATPSMQSQGAQRPSTAPSAQAQGVQRQPSASASSYGGGQTDSRSTGMSSGGFSGYQNGSATRAQSSRGTSSMSASRGGGRAGGGRR